jgi:glyoxylase-like metal-dependent hydrolase (beta-lactamase superfamily II)
VSPPSARAVAKAYEKRRTAFSSETELFGALRSVPLLGHTPGHTGFIVSSDGETLLIWADIVHHATFRFAHPEWGPAFDVDSVVAVSSRKRAFDHAVYDGIMVTGMNLPFAGFGHVTQESGSYRFVAAEMA